MQAVILGWNRYTYGFHDGARFQSFKLLIKAEPVMLLTQQSRMNNAKAEQVVIFAAGT
jgi:hypothetical protein